MPDSEPKPSEPSSTRDVERRLVEICRNFEQAFGETTEPDLEQFLHEASDLPEEQLRPELEQIATEMRARRPPDLGNAQLGDFRLIRKIGRGGMATVYEAVQESLDRHVALKILMLTPGQQEAIQRFRQEAHVVARLQHSHIIPVYGVGEEDGVHYLTMQLIHGCALDQVFASPDDNEPAAIAQLRDRDASHHPRLVARLGLDVADALSYAHQHGVLHRDIKPSNLLIDQDGDVWVADFGLAKSIEDQSELTRSGQLIGTLQYAPPEALDGHWDRRSDVYSLGMTLYRMLSGEHAFASETNQAELVSRILHESPTSLRQRRASIPRDLETIIHKSIEKSPGHRYANASELADELRRFLNNEPIRARPLNGMQRLTRWCQREPRLAALSAAVVLALLVGFIATSWQWSKAEDRARAESAAKRAASESERKLGVELERFYLDRWHSAGDEGIALESLVWLDKAMELNADTAQTANHKNAIRLATTLQQIPTITQMWFDLPNSWALAPAFHPDGKRIATAVGTEVRFHHVESGDEIGSRLKMDTYILWLKISPDGTKLATGGWGAVQLWSLEDFSPIGEELKFLEGELIGGSFDSGSRHLVVNGYKGFHLVDCATGKAAPGSIHTTHTMEVDMDFIPGTSTVVSKHQRWDAATAEPQADLFSDPQRAYGMEFSNDGEFVVTAHQSYLNVWDIATGHRRFEPVPFKGLDFRAWHVDLGPDQHFAAVAGGHGVMIVDVTEGKTTSRPMRHAAFVNDVEFSPAGDILATASSDSTVRLWRVPTGEPVGVALAHDAPVIHANFSSGGRQLLTASSDGVVRLWDLAGAVNTREVIVPHVCQAAIIPGTDNIVASFTERQTRVIDGDSLTPIGPSLDHDEVPRLLAVGGDGRRACVISGSGPTMAATVWDLDSRESRSVDTSVDPKAIHLSPRSRHLTVFFDVLISTYPIEGDAGLSYKNLVIQFRSGHHHSRNGIAFTADDTRLFVSVKSAVEARSMVQEEPVASAWIAQPTEDLANPMALSPDSALFAVAPGANIVKLVDSSTFEIRKKFRVTGVEAVEFSPGGNQIAVASSQGYARVFDVATGDPISPPMRHNDAVNYIAYSHATGAQRPRWIATADASGNVRIWDAKTFQAITPPLPQGAAVTRLQFFADGKRLLITNANRQLRIWRFPRSAPATGADRGRLIRFLSRRSYDQQGDLALLSSDNLPAEWDSARAARPDWFRVNDLQIRAWREQQIALAQSQGNAFAEQFHRRLRGSN